MTLHALLLEARGWVVSRRSPAFARYRASPAYRDARKDVERVGVQPGLELEVFSKNIPRVGAGPACSVVIAGEEVLRLDCFGPGAGHLHADFLVTATRPERRLFFIEDAVPAQVERSLFEIRRNLRYYTSHSRWPAARRFVADPALLDAALERVRQLMMRIHQRSMLESRPLDTALSPYVR